jgi:hypothetical protein
MADRHFNKEGIVMVTASSENRGREVQAGSIRTLGVVSAGVVLAGAVACTPASTMAARAGSTVTPSPSVTPACVPTGSSSTNPVIVTRDGFPGHTNPAIAIDHRDPRRLIGAAQFVTPGQDARLVPGAFWSADGGRTWRVYGPLPLPPGYHRGDDVSAGFTGRIGLVAAEAYADNGGSSVFVWRSTDGGRHFSTPTNVFTAPAGTRNTDHPWLAVTPGGTIAIAWNLNNDLLFSRSTDTGVTFSTPRRISAPDDVSPNLAVLAPGPNQQISIMYQAGTQAAQGGKSSTTLKTVTSPDGGETFDPTRSVPYQPEDGFTPEPFASSLPTAAADTHTGELYVAVARSPRPGSPRRIAVYRSSDQGRTWSPPVTVDSDPHNPDADQFQPSLTIDDNGTVFVSYYSLAAGKVSRILTASTADATTFTTPTLLGRPFDPACGLRGVWKVSPWIGDYQGLASAHGKVYAVWTDAGTGTAQIAAAALATNHTTPVTKTTP